MPPHGEPEWVTIAAGEFTMGEPQEAHPVQLPEHAIARVPITNAQYQLFVQASGREPPGDWNGKRAPRGRESQPVVAVTWHDALAYCRWLSEATGKPIGLPSEAEWEKAARGADDTRVYPWGDTYDLAKCNVGESGFVATTPVGIYAIGSSPYGCLDMAGNVWEWTRCRKNSYPYTPDDGREISEAERTARVTSKVEPRAAAHDPQNIVPRIRCLASGVVRIIGIPIVRLPGYESGAS